MAPTTQTRTLLPSPAPVPSVAALTTSEREMREGWMPQRVTRIAPTDAVVMEPTYDGGYRETSVRKHSWGCPGCGLVWAIKWHAETCDRRGHVDIWAQMYCDGIENGQPIRPRSYPRQALGRLPT